MKDYWWQFAQTGSIADYLKYKEQERQGAFETNASDVLRSYENYNQGACDKRADNGGE